MSTLQRLRNYAIHHSLFLPATLKAAVERLGFVQADPIRAPARAQDLILRHRVRGYCAGDLERRYPALRIEEDTLYAYGFLPRDVWRLIHPRNTKRLTMLEKRVLSVVSESGRTHPRELVPHFGSERVVNAWGGFSKATTHALDHLHYRGFLRIAGRENGLRIYEPATKSAEPLPNAERLRRLILVIANILAPVPEKTLRATIARYSRLGNTGQMLKRLLQAGELERDTADGLHYIWPTEQKPEAGESDVVRFLAPFDPLVWDRRRFEHFWQWPYRFEAYTPPARRIRGYYAMPLLFRDQMIGWVNASVDGGRLNIEAGFVNSRPNDRAFASNFDAEVASMEAFLGLHC